MTDIGPPVAVQPIAVQPVTGQVADCAGDVCITCSDTAVACEVIALLDDDLATVATAAGQEEVSVALVRAEVGDTILVHAGEAIAVMRK